MHSAKELVIDQNLWHACLPHHVTKHSVLDRVLYSLTKHHGKGKDKGTGDHSMLYLCRTSGLVERLKVTKAAVLPDILRLFIGHFWQMSDFFSAIMQSSRPSSLNLTQTPYFFSFIAFLCHNISNILKKNNLI